jgi:hypothetical protein
MLLVRALSAMVHALCFLQILQRRREMHEVVTDFQDLPIDTDPS